MPRSRGAKRAVVEEAPLTRKTRKEAPEPATKKPKKAPAAPVKPRVDAVWQDPDLKVIKDTIDEFASLPESCRELLLICARGGLAVSSDARHELQVWAVGLLSEAIDLRRRELEAAVESQKEGLQKLEASKAELTKEVSSAEAGVFIAEGRVKEAEASAAAAARAVEDSKQAVVARVQDLEAARAAGEKIRTSKQSVDDAVNQHLGKILEGNLDWEDLTQATVHCNAVVPVLEALGLDGSLITAFPSVCTKSPDRRGSFDNLALQQADKEMREKSAKLEAEGAQNVQAAQACEAALKEAEDALLKAQSHAAAAGNDRDSTQAELAAATAKLEEARNAVEVFEPNRLQLVSEVEECVKKHEHFTGFTQSVFQKLCEKKDKVDPPAEGEAEVAEVVAAEEAADVAAEA